MEGHRDTDWFPLMVVFVVFLILSSLEQPAEFVNVHQTCKSVDCTFLKLNFIPEEKRAQI